MSERTCSACQISIPSSVLGRYCYLHLQIYDSLKAEYNAVRKTSKGTAITWKEFLFKKNNEQGLSRELREVIKAELISSGTAV
jgi:hypothetical protein